MARRRRGRQIDGWLILDKRKGVSSAEALDEVKRIVKPQKAGHAGTLDPLATGVLALALGEATKTVPYLMGAAKQYRFTVTFGEERDTDDAEGKVIASSAMRPSRAEILTALPAFIGEIQQVPPTYAALKIGGERAYDLARRGETVVHEPRLVRVDALELKGEVQGDEAEFELVCGKGTYVRAIARDLGRRLDGHGYVSALRRTGLGPFMADKAHDLDAIRDADGRQALLDLLHPIGAALSALPAVGLATDEADQLRTGRNVHVGATIQGIGPVVVRAEVDGEVIGIASYSHGVIRPVRVFRSQPPS